MKAKLLLSVFVLMFSCSLSLLLYTSGAFDSDTAASVQQLNNSKTEVLTDHKLRAVGQTVIPITTVIALVLIWLPRKRTANAVIPLILLSMMGCRRPFEPVKYEMIEPNEAGFMISNKNVSDQASTSPEDYTKSMVNSQQVQIPQMWKQSGYETFGPNGEWIDAAVLIKVDMSSITREWTADPNSGTSTKNEAIWVMTSDQVEFSTGWTCTAKIASKADAAKFLSNYKNGTLANVMDQEIRAKIQSEFGLAVTDLPMDTLRKSATPVIKTVTKTVTDFFTERGITITNIGITGGFVYKDPKIIAKMVEVFTAEQEKSISIAKTVAQEETNKQIQLEAQAKADAILVQKEAEAKGIQAVADAKAYEISKAQENKELYLELKKIELQQTGLERWDGKYPLYLMGGSGQGGFNMLMNVPSPLQPTATK